VRIIGNLPEEPLEREYGELNTTEVVLNDERIEHILKRHFEDFAYFSEYVKETVERPDYILKDVKNRNTVFLVKKLERTNLNIVVRLSIALEDEKWRYNSVMTSYRVCEKNLRKLIDKSKMLYSKE